MHSRRRAFGSILNFSIYELVKFSRYRPGVAQRVGRGIALFFHNCGTTRGWVVSSMPRPHFTPGKDPVLSYPAHIYELVKVEILLSSLIFCKTVNLKKSVFYIKCVLRSSSHLIETFFAAINIKQLNPNTHSETHEGKSKMTGNFVPLQAIKVQR